MSGTQMDGAPEVVASYPGGAAGVIPACTSASPCAGGWAGGRLSVRRDAPRPGGWPTVYVCALGRIDPRFPGLASEKEFAQVAGRADTKGLTDRQTLYAVLSDRQNRYLVRLTPLMERSARECRGDDRAHRWSG